MSLKLFYKPEQVKNGLKDFDKEKFETNELIYVDKERAQTVDVNSIKSKCSIFDSDEYAQYVLYFINISELKKF